MMSIWKSILPTHFSRAWITRGDWWSIYPEYPQMISPFPTPSYPLYDPSPRRVVSTFLKIPLLSRITPLLPNKRLCPCKTNALHATISLLSDNPRNSRLSLQATNPVRVESPKKDNANLHHMFPPGRRSLHDVQQGRRPLARQRGPADAVSQL